MAKIKTKAKRDNAAGEDGVPVSALNRLAGPSPLLAVDHLYAGYGAMTVVRDGRRPSRCSHAIPRLRRGDGSAPMCCRAASGGSWKFPAR